MPDFILNRSNVILCPHGGHVAPVPISPLTEFINGDVPRLVNDQLIIAGRPFAAFDGLTPCLEVVRTNPSVTKRIDAIPVLTNAKSGIATSGTAVSRGISITETFRSG